MASTKRQAVLDAAIELIRHDETGFSIAAIAAEAGVSTQGVYYLFETKAGLYAAMAEYIGEDVGFDRTVADMAAMDAHAALEFYVRRRVDELARYGAVYAAIDRAAAVDPDLAREAAEIARSRRAVAVDLAGRLVDECGGLHDDLWTIGAVGDLLWMLLRPGTYLSLAAAEWDGEKIVARTIFLVDAVLGADAPTSDASLTDRVAVLERRLDEIAPEHRAM